MKLLTQAVRKALPKLYSQENVEDPMVPVKFFDPCGSATWWILEGQPEGIERVLYDGTEDDYIMFGLCDLGVGSPELGYVSTNELQAFKGPLGIGIERDLSWTSVPLSKVKAQQGIA